jgi:hypothetical protein
MNQYSHFAVEEAEIIQQSAAVDPSDWRLLRRLQIPDRFNDPQGGTVKGVVMSQNLLRVVGHLSWRCGCHGLDRQLSDKPQGRKSRGIRLAVAACSVYGVLMTACRLWQMAKSVSSIGFGWRQHREGGLAAVLACRWQGLEAVSVAVGGLGASGTVASCDRQY